ncbi:MAG: FHA domain-containing protein [Chloroflexota bacterium]
MPVQSFRLTMRSGPAPGKSFPLEQEEIFLGRDLSNDIPISDPEISRRHARFLMRADGIVIEDLGSTNGTFINGMRISAPQVLHPGDVITFGENIVVVFEPASYDPNATVIASKTKMPAQPAQRQAPPQQPLPPAPVYHTPAPVYHAPAPAYQAPPPAPEKKKFPTWLMVLIIVAIVSCIIVSIVLLFMPASWWCALTFNSLAGCPAP